MHNSRPTDMFESSTAGQDAHGDDILTIRQMSEAFDVTPRTLRFYEDKELIFPNRVGQKRLYNKSDRARLTLILRGKRFGFSLEDIRQLLNLYNIGDAQRTQMERTHILAQERLVDLERQRVALDGIIEDLQDQISWFAKILASMPEKNQRDQHSEREDRPNA